jgi:hypothetical protein
MLRVKNPGKPIDFNNAACASRMGILGAIPKVGDGLKAFAWNVMQGRGAAFVCGDAR